MNWTAPNHLEGNVLWTPEGARPNSFDPPDLARGELLWRPRSAAQFAHAQQFLQQHYAIWDKEVDDKLNQTTI